MPPLLVGRDRELEELEHLVGHEDARLVTLTGPPGVGKSRLLEALLARLDGHFPDGLLAVYLAPIADPSLVLVQVARAAGLPQLRPAALEDDLITWLQGKQALLGLDNFEHLMSAAPLIGRLLQACGDLQAVVTSREPLRLSIEQRYEIEPLPVPPVGASWQEAQYGAVELFIRRAEAIRPGFALGESNAGAVIDLCQRLDGLPLAIELAAARLSLLSPDAISERLERRLGLLIHGPRDAPVRHQTLRAAIDWSYGLLTEAEQQVFEAVSVFAGGVELDDLEAVLSGLVAPGTDILEAIQELIEKSMLRREGSDRIGMMQVLREYAAERLAAGGSADQITAEHASHYLALALEAARQLRLSGDVARLRRLDKEQENFRAALAWFLDCGQEEQALNLATALSWYWVERADLAGARIWLSRALDKAGAGPLDLRARALCAMATVAWELGDLELVTDCAGAALDLAIQAGDSSIRAWARSLAAMGKFGAGEFDAADWADISSQLAATDQLLELAQAHVIQGWHFLGLDRFTEAQRHGRDAHALYASMANSSGLARSVVVEGYAALEEGHQDQARELFEEALRLDDALGEYRQQWWALSGLGLVCQAKAELEQAETYFQRGLAHAQAVNHALGIVGGLDFLACVAIFRGQFAEAVDFSRQAILESHKRGVASCYTAVAVDCLAAAAAGAGQHQEAALLHGAASPFWRDAEGQQRLVFAGQQPRFETHIEASKRGLGVQRFEQLFQQGQTMQLSDLLELAGRLLKRPMQAAPGAVANRASSYDLTARELEVLQLVAHGLSNPAIAGRLVLSAQTVNNHLRSIYGKLDVHSRTAAASVALHQGLVKPVPEMT